jgi:hypothetical protein
MSGSPVIAASLTARVDLPAPELPRIKTLRISADMQVVARIDEGERLG